MNFRNLLRQISRGTKVLGKPGKKGVYTCVWMTEMKNGINYWSTVFAWFSCKKKILTTNCKIVSHNDIRLLCLLRWFFHKRYLYFRLNREWQKETVTAGRTKSLSFLGGNRWRILFFFDKTFITFCYRIYLFCQQYIFAETLDVCWWNISSLSSHILIWERNISRPCARLQAIS